MKSYKTKAKDFTINTTMNKTLSLGFAPTEKILFSNPD
jgi:hypothetical protein